MCDLREAFWGLDGCWRYKDGNSNIDTDGNVDDTLSRGLSLVGDLGEKFMWIAIMLIVLVGCIAIFMISMEERSGIPAALSFACMISCSIWFIGIDILFVAAVLFGLIGAGLLNDRQGGGGSACVVGILFLSLIVLYWADFAR